MLCFGGKHSGCLQIGKRCRIKVSAVPPRPGLARPEVPVGRICCWPAGLVAPMILIVPARLRSVIQPWPLAVVHRGLNGGGDDATLLSTGTLAHYEVDVI